MSYGSLGPHWKVPKERAGTPQKPRSPAKPALPRVSEKAQQAAIVKLLRSLGGQVYVIGTTRKRGDFQGTCQTPGIPDLLCFLPLPPPESGIRQRLLFIEVKARGGRLRPGQFDFQQSCIRADVVHLVGDADLVLGWVTEAGYLLGRD